MQAEYCWKVEKFFPSTFFILNFLIILECVRHAKQDSMDFPNANLVTVQAQRFARSKPANVFARRESQARSAINVCLILSASIKLLDARSVIAIHMVFLMEINSAI